MNSIYSLDTKVSYNRRRVEDFLAGFNLGFEEVDETLISEENGEIIATGSRDGDIFKCFAICDEKRGQGIFDEIISMLIKSALEKNIRDIFVYTKKEYKNVFSSFSFKILAEADESVLMLRTDESLDEMMDFHLEEKDYDAIVINANPFTLGHKYLIEKAKKERPLLVFLVENDKSYFKTEDRYEIAKRCLEEMDYLNDVKLIKSGKLIISQSTFPSYFLKEKSLISREHAIIDAKIFKKIAKKNRIVKRYLGDEPLDPSTKIYNEILEKVLKPELDVEIIKRLEKNGQVVSASRVRKLFEEADFKSIETLVPRASLEYLKNEYTRLKRK